MEGSYENVKKSKTTVFGVTRRTFRIHSDRKCPSWRMPWARGPRVERASQSRSSGQNHDSASGDAECDSPVEGDQGEDARRTAPGDGAGGHRRPAARTRTSLTSILSAMKGEVARRFFFSWPHQKSLDNVGGFLYSFYFCVNNIL